MALIEGFRVQNYRALSDVTLGKLSTDQLGEPLTPFTVVIGKNGAGKSTLFDAFGFVADCLNKDVEGACDDPRRGGFDRMRSLGTDEPIRFEIYYREAPGERPITYELAINVDSTGRPFVESEVLKQRRKGQKHGRPFPFLRLSHGLGEVWAGEEAVADSGGTEDTAKTVVELTDLRQLGIATLGTLKEHPRIKRFRDFLKGWYLSYFYPDAARRIPSSGPQKHLNVHGDNIGNVVQYMQRQPELFSRVLQRIAQKIPGIDSIKAEQTIDGRVALQFNDGAFKDPFLAGQMSDGTLKVFAYLLLMEDPEPPPFICIEEPENGLYHKLLESLATELRAHAIGKRNTTQVFVTTHQPYFVDALQPNEVWILKKGKDGFSRIKRVSDIALVRNLVEQGLPLGGLWYSDYLDTE